MALTNHRILLLKYPVPWHYRAFTWFAAMGRRQGKYARAIGALAMGSSDSACIDFSDIERIWHWKPEFAHAPAIQFADTTLLYFALLDGGVWRPIHASRDAVREHVEAIEATMHAAQAPGE